ncbi:MAG TPA: hypothetical protein VIL98_07580 [Gaiellaceae bacterium]
MASTATNLDTRPTRRDRLAYQLRIVRAIAVAEFKLRYAGSALGYLWSVLKPLALFTMLYLYALASRGPAGTATRLGRVAVGRALGTLRRRRS